MRHPITTTLCKWSATIWDCLTGRDFIVGDDLTVADILLAARLRYVHGDEVLEPFAEVRRYLAALYARPAYERTFAVNGTGPL